MNFAIKGDFAKQLTVLLKKDAALARSFAQQWLSKIEPDALHAYLLSQEAATDLLVQLLQKAPEKTLDDLHKLQAGKNPRLAKKAVGRKKKAAQTAPKKRGPGRPKKAASLPKKKRGPGRPKKKRGPGRPKKVTAKPAHKVKAGRKATVKPKAGKRIRLTVEQVEKAKDKILKLLGSQTWGTRKELMTAAALPTQAAYRRVVVELLDAGKIVAKGERSKRVYGLKKGKKGKKGVSRK